MRTIVSSLQSRLEQSPLKLCRIFELTLASGPVFRFTDHDQDVVFGSDTFAASEAITVAAIESSSGAVAVNTDLEINYVDGFDRAAAISGLYDNATIKIWVLSYDAPNDGRFLLMSGTLEQKATNNRNYGSFNLKGLAYKIDGMLGEYYSQECRANLGDARCKVDLTSFTHSFTVASVSIAKVKFVVNLTGTLPSGSFTLGNLQFAGDTYAIEIIQDTYLGSNQREFTLAIPRFNDIEVSDAGSAIEGCDKRLSTCLTRFNNILNFRGEPFVPNQDIAGQTS